MKRVHRRWHRRMGWLLVPVLAATLGLIAFRRGGLPSNATLPPAPSTFAAGTGR